MSDAVTRGIYAGLGIADQRQRRREYAEAAPLRQGHLDYQNLLNQQLQSQLGDKIAEREALSPREDGKTPAQRQLAYYQQTGQADKAAALVNDLFLNAERISKTAGTGRAGVDYVNQQLPDLKLEYKGADDDGWEWILSAEHGFLGFHPASGQTKHVPFPKPADKVPKTISYKSDGFEVTEIYRGDGSTEVKRSPIKQAENKPDKPKEIRQLFIKVGDYGEITETRSVDIYDADEMAEANADGFKPQSSQTLLMGDPYKAMVNESARSAMGPAGKVKAAEKKAKQAEGTGKKKVKRRGVDTNTGRPVVMYEDGTVDYAD